ncbi:MAG: lipase family protein [Eggerthellaceae bacterium]|nr:lipase family protein [Eggerthellaceae bacterium]
MKKLFSLMAATLAAVLLLFPNAAFADDSFLVGDWATSSGDATFSFYENGTCVSDFGLWPEEGTWKTEDTGSAAFPIEIDGSSVLWLMQLAYGGVDEGYHFEVLKCNDDNFYLVQVYGDYTAWSSNCKLPLTRVGAKADFTLPSEGSAHEPNETRSEGNDEAEASASSEIQKMDVAFDDDNTVSLNWGWDLFGKDSSEYDHDIAMAALVLSQAAELGQQAGEQRMRDLGFENTSSVYYGGNAENAEMPATVFASKDISLNGAQRVVVAIAVRGTKTDEIGDWLTDLRSQIDGFYPAADNVRNQFKSYYGSLSDRYGFTVNSSNTILFITGHSMGAAVASQLAQMLEGSCGSRNAIFAYTFATPNHETFNYNRESFTNVHNIVNLHDAVPNVPFGYKKYGHTWYYDSSESRYQPYYERVYGENGWHPRNIVDEHICSTYLAMMLCNLPYNMGDGAVNPYSLTSVHCPVDIAVYSPDGALMGATKGEDASIEDAGTVLVMADGDEKYVYAPPGEPYTVKIVGTGSGEMTVSQQSIDPDTGDIVSEKTFENVAVEEGRQFSLAVSGDAQVDDVSLETADGEAQNESADDGQPGAEQGDSGFQWWQILLIVVGVVALVFVILLVIGTVKNTRKQNKRKKKASKKRR